MGVLKWSVGLPSYRESGKFLAEIEYFFYLENDKYTRKEWHVIHVAPKGAGYTWFTDSEIDIEKVNGSNYKILRWVKIDDLNKYLESE